jgi:uncharacterized protein (DUF2384 family)
MRTIQREALKLFLLLDLAVSLPAVVLLILVSPERHVRMLRHVADLTEIKFHKIEFRYNRRAREIALHVVDALGWENAQEWLYSKSRHLWNRRPIDLLLYGTEEEREAIDTRMGQLEHGIHP